MLSLRSVANGAGSNHYSLILRQICGSGRRRICGSWRIWWKARWRLPRSLVSGRGLRSRCLRRMAVPVPASLPLRLDLTVSASFPEPIIQDTTGEPVLSAPLPTGTTRIAAVSRDLPCGVLWRLLRHWLKIEPRRDLVCDLLLQKTTAHVARTAALSRLLTKDHPP
jgi:hypothetical protein